VLGHWVADTSRSVANTATFKVFTSFVAIFFSLSRSKNTFLPKSAQKWYNIQKKKKNRKYLYHFLGGARPRHFFLKHSLPKRRLCNIFQSAERDGERESRQAATVSRPQLSDCLVWCLLPVVSLVQSSAVSALFQTIMAT